MAPLLRLVLASALVLPWAAPFAPAPQAEHACCAADCPPADAQPGTCCRPAAQATTPAFAALSSPEFVVAFAPTSASAPVQPHVTRLTPLPSPPPSQWLAQGPTGLSPPSSPA